VIPDQLAVISLNTLYWYDSNKGQWWARQVEVSDQRLIVGLDMGIAMDQSSTGVRMDRTNRGLWSLIG
jgi:hypothetical protein